MLALLSSPAYKYFSPTRTVHGSVAQTRIRTVYCDNTFQRAQTYPDGAHKRSKPLRIH